MQSIATRQSILLRAGDDQFFASDEYFAGDNGRLHLLGLSCFAHYYPVDGILDYKKAAIPVTVVFLGDEWPDPILGCKDPAAIAAYFAEVSLASAASTDAPDAEAVSDGNAPKQRSKRDASV
jgi:hypothetical protein